MFIREEIIRFVFDVKKVCLLVYLITSNESILILFSLNPNHDSLKTTEQ